MGNEREKKMIVGLAWNYGGELKFLITSLLFVFCLITVLQFLSNFPQFSIFSPSTCVSSISTSTATATSTTPPPPSIQQDELPPGHVIKRSFNPYGAAAYTFNLMSAYRGGPSSFSVIGLSSKPLHIYSKPSYQCQWVPHNSTSSSVTVTGHKILPDWGFGRVYTTVVVTCTFRVPTGADGSGGKLLLHANSNGGGDTKFNRTDTIEALTEKPQSLNPRTLNSSTESPKYDYLYCGSSLYGNLSPQRMREWLAYHVRLFGPRSHFVFHDAGGVHTAVMEVLRPWIELGFVTLQDIREQERFDGYYHNQFLIVNDCLHRFRFEAKWIFFFDVDEYIYLPNKKTIKSVTDSLSEFTQFTIEQMTMSNKLCLSEDGGRSSRMWGFEKLVYRDVKRGIRRDRKYAVQPRNVLATGVHLSQNMAGKTNYRTWHLIKYFHYHGTIAERNEPCREFTNATSVTVDRTPYAVDAAMRSIASAVKEFELKMIGPRLQGTQQ